jgi:hypothetical protein
MDLDFRPIIYALLIILLLIFGAWKTLDYFFIDETIDSKELIVPEVKLYIHDNVVDTLYIYRKPGKLKKYIL